ncbi:MAG: glycosyltransferase [Actinomycetota bacterium]
MTGEPGTAQALPLVSVVVAAPDAEGELDRCLASLLDIDYPAGRYELLIVDNGSRDRTAEIVKRFPVRNLDEPRSRVSHARNAGIRASRGDVVAFTDPDCLVSKQWLLELASGFADPDVDAVAGAIVPYPPRTHAELYAARRRSHSQERVLSHPLRPFAMTPNLAFRREIFDRVGLFDTRFPGGGWEDADLCWRFSRDGAKIRYAPRAVVFHRYRATAREFLVQQYRYGYGLSLIYGKYSQELRWSWAERVRAASELETSVAGLAKAGIRSLLGADRDAELAFRYFDFLRLLGQRSGFAAAAILGR